MKSEGPNKKKKQTDRVKDCSGELEFSQVMLICRYIKKWEDLFRNIDFHRAGMKTNIGHHLQCVSTQLQTVTIKIASNTWMGSQRGEMQVSLSGDTSGG